MDTHTITLVFAVTLLTFAGAVFSWALATRRRSYR
jgi:hypothetical protein